MTELDLVVVRTFSNRFEADVARSALEAASIDSMIRPDDAGGMRPGLWIGRGVDVLVRGEDAQRANEVLEKPAHRPPHKAPRL